MAFKFITIITLLAAANAGHISPTSPFFKYVNNHDVNSIAVTQQNLIRSFDGSMSSDSKSVDTPYSSVRKVDTRINNEMDTPAVAKTVAYTAPIVRHNMVNPPTFYSHAKTVAYAAPSVTKSSSTPITYTHATPAAAKAIVTPAIYGPTRTVAYDSPSATKNIAIPTVYTHAAPAGTKTVYSHASPVTYEYSQVSAPKTVAYSAPAITSSYNHGPDATTYSHKAPGLSGYGTSHTIHYSPAEMVSHMSFDGFGTHWGF